ncbi:alpha/beta family hydrolase [Litoribacillus peritrichatus]|uniref:KANL3/Tex30 alpha/beta hydrolase-like domain-containing protein n=1 Tax=Litoribacillus peritrichatus TaxID=718191 RepID=A0ABP7N4X5_9GAMM
MTILVTDPMDEGKNITLILAHGAGAPMDSEFMEEVAQLYSSLGIKVIRFEFPYMAERRDTGKKRPPDRAPKLVAHWKAVAEQVLKEIKGPCFVGGKSMGGRMSTMLLAEHDLPIKGSVCFGYPYHAPGKPEKVRDAHFADVEQPILILQGERDAFGTKDEVMSYTTYPGVEHHWLKDGNHDLKPRKASGVTHEENIKEAVIVSSQWMANITDGEEVS